MNARPTANNLSKATTPDDCLRAWGLRHAPFSPDEKSPAIYPAGSHREARGLLVSSASLILLERHPAEIDPLTLVLILDDAQNYPAPALEEIRMLLGLGGRLRGAFALILRHPDPRGKRMSPAEDGGGQNARATGGPGILPETWLGCSRGKVDSIGRDAHSPTQPGRLCSHARVS